MFNDQVKKTQLENGIRIVTEYMPSVRSVAVGIWIGVGSANERPDNNGISHFLEHMVFKGTKKRSARDIALSLESLGGSINGSTGKDVTIYNAYVLDEYIDVALDVLIDIIKEPKFAEQDIALEKTVVLSEINHSKENPEELISDYLYYRLFPNHPLGYFILGKPENIQHFNRDHLFNYLNSEYTGDRIVFAAAGNVDHDHVVDLVRQKYEPNTLSSAKASNIPLPETDKGTFFYHNRSSHQAHICMGTRIFGYNDERKYELALLDLLLGGGMSSRLFQNIREKYGFAYNVYSFSDLMKDTGIFGCYMACDVNKVDQSTDLLLTEIDKIRKNSIASEELDRIKSQVKGMLILGMESSARRMRKIAETEIYNAEHIRVEKVLQKVEKIVPSDLTEIAREFLDESNLTLAVLTP